MVKIITLYFLAITLCTNAQKVYNFTLNNLNNEPVSFEGLKGEKLTIVDFWATWCKPCQASIPKINKIYEEYKTKGVNFIGINIDSPRNQAKVKPFSNAMGISYQVLLDTDQEVMGEFNVSSIPVLFFINAKNEIVYTHEGYAMGDENELKKKIEELLTE